MNHQDKAKQLVEKFGVYMNSNGPGATMDDLTGADMHDAKECATICVDQIIEAIKITTGHCTLRRLEEQEVEMDFDYWDRVKQEIQKL